MNPARDWRHAGAYLLTLVLSILVVSAIIRYGDRRLGPNERLAAPSTASSTRATTASPPSGRSPVAVLLTQIAVIIVVSTALGRAATHLGQPRVIGEITAGLMLGPSVLGLVWPGAMEWLFPSESFAALRLLAEFGIVLFMFLVGTEVQLEHVHQCARTAIVVSHVSIVVPFILGTALAILIFEPMTRPGMEFIPFALFMGVGMSITAFPVLARIIEERGLRGTPLGDTVLTCAAVDDVTAWCLLALVVAIVRATSTAAVAGTALLALAFSLVMLLVIGPLLRTAWSRRGPAAGLSRGEFGLILAGVLLAALATESIGIHALFGAFVAGLVIPRAAPFRAELREKLEWFSTAGLMPIFFAYTGLRTHLTVLRTAEAWLIALAIFVVAVAGKLGGSMLAARASGMGWRESFKLGALMNARGLVELVVLNVGFDLGVLTRRIFSVMVLMALITTLMTGPLLRLAARGRTGHAPAQDDAAAA